MITDDIIRQITDRILAHVSPVRIVLFGSCARGEITRDSDVDLLIVEDEPFEANRSRHDEAVRIRRSLNGLGVPIDILVFSPDEVLKWSQAKNHVVAHALREGKVLYERS